MERDSKTVKTALLVMDIQEATMGRVADSKSLLQSLKTATGAARTAGIPVIYVVVGFRKGFPEVSPDNKSFSAIKSGGMSMSTLEDPQPAMAPQAGELVVTKRRVSAFAGSDLEVILRAGQIRHLVLTGVATSGVVLSTLREAADKDFQLTVISDCCADTDEEVHRVLLTKVFTRQADVLTAEQWIAGTVK
jgi:nicotinamidase-related amidase